MTGGWPGHLAYALAWASFGLGHSLLARDRVKDRLRPWLGAWYRLAYNGFAVVHIAAVWLFGRWLLGDAPAYALPEPVRLALYGVQGLGAVILLVGLTGYDLGRFGGLAQVRNHRRGVTAPEDEPLRVDGLHRYVRHPLYLGGLLLLWGNVRDPFSLATAVWGSLYLGIGTWFEERSLLRRYGRAYADYRARVPAVVPWRGRAI